MLNGLRLILCCMLIGICLFMLQKYRDCTIKRSREIQCSAAYKIFFKQKSGTFACHSISVCILKKVIVSVTNDLSTDQRVDKVCRTLSEMGFDVTLTGRWLPGCLPLNDRPYKTHRMRLLFRKGPLFYAEYNIRLLIYLLARKSNLLVSNDLDTLPANFAAHKLKRTPIVYDSHEYYTETPELVNRPFVQGIWERIERFIFPKLTDIITVNQSIADLYEKKYGKKLNVVRNIPRLQTESKPLSREECGLPADKSIILMQGAGINIQRGAEETVEAMKFVDNAILLIIGGGDVIGKLKEMAKNLKLEDKIVFKNRLPYPELIRHTRLADIGLTLDKNTNINYRFSLPNKLFDYIHAGIPVLASRLPEIARIVEGYDIGRIAESHDPEYLGNLITNMLSDVVSQKIWRKNLLHASSELTWEKEAITLIELYKKYV